MSIPQPQTNPYPQAKPGAKHCRACGGTNLEPFYRAPNIPIHCIRLIATREEALAVPRGDLELAYCPSCGFIQNTEFDFALLSYDENYEETQGFSPTFGKFAKELARKLVEGYGVQGQKLLEIGCGKGEFLLEVCKQGGNTGLGMDPAAVPGRLLEAQGVIEYVIDWYENHTGRTPEADVVMHRHTLEHIPEVAQFVRAVRTHMRSDALYFMEVPDVRRILEECAFWDIFYEHASYFTQGSLGRLHRRAGFHVLENVRAYNDQYILLYARPGEPNALLPEEDDLELLNTLVPQFKQAVVQEIARWQGLIRGWHAQGKKVVIWGASSKGVSFLTTLGLQDEIEYAVDINPYKQGFYMPATGHKVVGPDFLETYRPDVVLVMNPIYLPEIGKMLAERGLHPEMLGVGAR